MLLPKPKPPPFVPAQLNSIRLAYAFHRRGILFRKFNHLYLSPSFLYVSY